MPLGLVVDRFDQIQTILNSIVYEDLFLLIFLKAMQHFFPYHLTDLQVPGIESSFRQPVQGQSLINYLSSQDFNTCANLDKVHDGY